MKRSVIFLFTILFAMAALAVSAFADDTVSYDIDEMDMTISLPSDFITFTRDTSASDPNLSTYGLTKDSLSTYMTSNSIYFDAWDPDINYEIIITMTDGTVEDFNSLSDEYLASLATSIESTYQDAGLTYIKSEVYQHT